MQKAEWGGKETDVQKENGKEKKKKKDGEKKKGEKRKEEKNGEMWVRIKSIELIPSLSRPSLIAFFPFREAMTTMMTSMDSDHIPPSSYLLHQRSLY